MGAICPGHSSSERERWGRGGWLLVGTHSECDRTLIGFWPSAHSPLLLPTGSKELECANIDHISLMNCAMWCPCCRHCLDWKLDMARLMVWESRSKHEAMYYEATYSLVWVPWNLDMPTPPTHSFLFVPGCYARHMYTEQSFCIQGVLQKFELRRGAEVEHYKSSRVLVFADNKHSW